MEGCDYFIHDLYNSMGMFCPCVSDEVIYEWHNRMREFIRGDYIR